MGPLFPRLDLSHHYVSKKRNFLIFNLIPPSQIGVSIMKKTISIRPRQPSDIPILSNLRSVHKNSGYPVEGVANPESFITPPNQLKAWVALTDDGNIVGHIAVMPTDPHSLAAKVSTGDISKTASLGRLFVDPEVRGRGLGRVWLQLLGTGRGRRG